MSGPNLVTVASFRTSPNAWIYRNFLADQGLDAFVADQHIVDFHWGYSNAVGGVKVQIPDSQLNAFATIDLPDHPVTASDMQEVKPAKPWNPSVCPACGSREIFKTRWPRRLVFLSMLFFGLPFPFFSRSTICDDCGYEHRSPIEIPTQFELAHLLIVMILAAIVMGVSVNLGFNWLDLMLAPIHIYR